MGNRKRGVLILFYLVLLILFSFNIFALSCECEIQFNNAPISKLSKTSGTDTCSISCIDDTGLVKTACKPIGTYTVNMACSGASSNLISPCITPNYCSYSQNVVRDCATSSSCAEPDSLVHSLYYFPLAVPSPGCKDDETCFNGIDDDCDDTEFNQSTMPGSSDVNTWCPCNSEGVKNIGLLNPLTGFTDICVYDKTKVASSSDYYKWAVSNKDIFKIYSVVSNSNKEVDVVSNSKKWAVCGLVSDLSKIDSSYDVAVCTAGFNYVKVAVGSFCAASLETTTCTFASCNYGETTSTCTQAAGKSIYTDPNPSVVGSTPSGSYPSVELIYSGGWEKTGSCGAPGSTTFTCQGIGTDNIIYTYTTTSGCGSNTQIGATSSCSGDQYTQYNYYKVIKDYTCPLSGGTTCALSNGVMSCQKEVFNTLDYSSNVNQMSYYGSFPDIGVKSSALVDSDGDGGSDACELVFGTQNDPSQNSGCTDYASYVASQGGDTSSSQDSTCAFDDPTCVDNIDTTIVVDNENPNADSSTVSSTETETFPIDNLNLVFPDISKRFICYDNGGASNVAECCSFGKCFNNAYVNQSFPRALGNGQAIRTIKNYDKWQNSGIKNLPSSIIQGLTLTIPVNKSLTGYSSLEFDVKVYNKVGEKFDITIGSSSSDKLYIEDYTNGIPLSVGKVRHISIPVSKFPSTVDSFTITVPKTAKAAFDNFYFKDSGHLNNYYCSEYFAQWIQGLDPINPNDGQLYTEEKDILPYKWACKGIGSFGWTGTQCCGDGYQNTDELDHYVDSEGGCFKGYPVKNKQTMKEAVNLEQYKDILYYKYDNNNYFWKCNFDQSRLSSEYNELNLIRDLIKPVPRCTVSPNVLYFCDYNNTWNNQSSKGYGQNGQIFYPYNRTNYSNIPSGFPNYTSIFKEGKTESCCPEGFCWNSTDCIDGRMNVENVFSIPANYVYYPNKDDKDFGYICSEGNWNLTESKLSPHDDYSGFCWKKSQCYYKDRAGNEKCYNDKEFVNISEGFLDYYCNAGSWTSRSKLLADDLYRIAKLDEYKGSPFTIFCGNPQQKSFNSMNHESEIIDFSTFASYSLEETTEKYSSCVLTIDKNNDGIFGNSKDDNDVVIIGTPLLKSWEDSEFFIPASNCEWGNSLSSNPSFKQCDKQGDFDGSFFYNDETKILIYTQDDSLTVSFISGIFIEISNWIKRFLKNLYREEVTKELLVSEGVPEMDRYITTKHEFKNLLYTNLYYYNSGKNGADPKQIKGVMELKGYVGRNDKKYVTYTNFIHFNLGFCNNGTIKGVSVIGSDSSIYCNDKNTSVSSVIDPTDYGDINDYWDDLSSKLRPKKEPYNVNTVEEQETLITDTFDPNPECTIVPLYAVYNPTVNNYGVFLTQNNALLKDAKNYGYTTSLTSGSIIGYIHSVQDAGTVPLHMFVNASNNVTFYWMNTDASMRSSLLNDYGVSYLGVVGYVYDHSVVNSSPLYGAWNNINYYDSSFTTDKTLFTDFMAAHTDWNALTYTGLNNGEVAYLPNSSPCKNKITTNLVPLYAIYNPTVNNYGVFLTQNNALLKNAKTYGYTKSLTSDSIVGNIYSVQDPGTVPLHMFVKASNNVTFYWMNTDATMRSSLLNDYGVSYFDVVGYVYDHYVDKSSPLYGGFYNNNGYVSSTFTTNKTLFDTLMQQPGWSALTYTGLNNGVVAYLPNSSTYT